MIRTGSDADQKIGPAARSFAADAHDCIMVRTSTNLPNTSISEMGQYYALEVADQILHDRQLCNFIARTVMEIGCWERRIERSDWSSRAADRLTGQSRGCCRACRSPRSLHVIRGIGLVVCSSVEVEDFRQICLFFRNGIYVDGLDHPGPMVRRLPAGAKRIRTIGSARHDQGFNRLFSLRPPLRSARDLERRIRTAGPP